MLSRKKIIVADNERVALFENNHFKSMLGTGVYKYWDLSNSLSWEFIEVDETNSEVADVWINRLTSHSELENEIEIIEVGEQEVAILRAYKKILRIILPSERLALWKFIPGITVEKLDIKKDFNISKDLLTQLVTQNMLSTKGIAASMVTQNTQGLLYVDGKFERLLECGHHAFWACSRDIQIKLQSFKLQTLEVNGQEILSKDRVSLRLNLQAMYRVEDAQLVTHEVENISDYLYRRLQLALREVIGTRTLDQLLEAKNQVSDVIFEQTKQEFKSLGIELTQVGLKDIILPGEMKDILNQVVQAQKQAEANVIKRREETSATRSLLNTAKVMEGSPILMRLKEMEAQEKIAERIDKITVVGGVSDVMNSLVRMDQRT